MLDRSSSVPGKPQRTHHFCGRSFEGNENTTQLAQTESTWVKETAIVRALLRENWPTPCQVPIHLFGLLTDVPSHHHQQFCIDFDFDILRCILWPVKSGLEPRSFATAIICTNP
jgi:hypothetical protein